MDSKQQLGGRLNKELKLRARIAKTEKLKRKVRGESGLSKGFKRAGEFAKGLPIVQNQGVDMDFSLGSTRNKKKASSW